MSNPLNPQKALIFRIVHRDNLRWILDYGLHARNGKALDPDYRDIGNLDLIQKRSKRVVEIGPGGTLGDYVPFYFTPFSIMMYNIHTGYGAPRVKNEDIVILVSSLFKVLELGIPFVFTNQHAYPVMAEYFDDPDDLDEVDWDILNRKDFRHDPDDPGKKERYQAEALVWKHLPLEGFLGICSFNAEVDDWVKTLLSERHLNVKTVINKGWYF